MTDINVPATSGTEPVLPPVPVTPKPGGIYLDPAEELPGDLDELSLPELQVLHSRICRQLERDYRINPDGPHPVTLDRYHDVVVELDYRHLR